MRLRASESRVLNAAAEATPFLTFSLMLRSGLCVTERALSGMFGMGSEGGWADVNCGSSSTGSKMICNGGGLQERWAVGGELEEHFWAGSPSSCQLFGITEVTLVTRLCRAGVEG